MLLGKIFVLITWSPLLEREREREREREIKRDHSEDLGVDGKITLE
jgi:hypothetical protein